MADDQLNHINDDPPRGALLPAIGAVVLTLLWLAFLIPDASAIFSGR